MGSKDRGVHVQWPHILQSGQSWETQNITLSISSLPLCQPPAITSLSPADRRAPLTGPCYPGTGGEMQIDFISAVAFLGPPLVTHRLPFQAKIWKSAGNVKPQRDRIKRRVLFTAIAGSRSAILLNATLSASPLWELSIMLLTCAAVFSHWNHAADKNSRLKAADAWFMRGCYLRR